MNAASAPPLSVLDAIRQRHAVRAYVGTPLAADMILVLLEAAVRAPTAMHEEPWEFLVIRDKNALAMLGQRAKAALTRTAGAAATPEMTRLRDTFSNPDFDIFYGAPALIVVGTLQTGSFVEADCWLAAENLMLRACSLGLGSCVIGLALTALNDADTKAELGIPAGFHAVAPIVTGVPAPNMATAPTSRRPPHVLLWK